MLGRLSKKTSGSQENSHHLAVANVVHAVCCRGSRVLHGTSPGHVHRGKLHDGKLHGGELERAEHALELLKKHRRSARGEEEKQEAVNHQDEKNSGAGLSLYEAALDSRAIRSILAEPRSWDGPIRPLSRRCSLFGRPPLAGCRRSTHWGVSHSLPPPTQDPHSCFQEGGATTFLSYYCSPTCPGSDTAWAPSLHLECEVLRPKKVMRQVGGVGWRVAGPSLAARAYILLLSTSITALPMPCPPCI